MKEETIKKQYSERYERALQPAERVLDEFIREHMKGLPRIDRMSVRSKSVDRFFQKALKEENGQRNIAIL